VLFSGKRTAPRQPWIPDQSAIASVSITGTLKSRFPAYERVLGSAVRYLTVVEL